MAGKNKQKYVSVFIPTYNGLPYVTESIDAVLRQELPEDYSLELLVIDSGSTDGTVEALKRYGEKIRLLEIPNSEFSHGGTRDKAARLAKGEYVLFLSQDATPLHNRWLINMIEPFFLSPNVGCVYGAQRPRPNAAATIKREVATVFGALGSPDTIVVSRWKSLVDNHKEFSINNFFSDVNSASRKDLLVGEVPFRHVRYAEDQALAQDMQDRAYLKAYSPMGQVWHSNEYTPKEYFYRKFDEYRGLHESTGYKLIASKRSVLLGWIRPTLRDWSFIRHDGEYSRKSKLVWFIKSPLYNVWAKAGQYAAAKSAQKQETTSKYSLEERAKKD